MRSSAGIQLRQQNCVAHISAFPAQALWPAPALGSQVLVSACWCILVQLRDPAQAGGYCTALGVKRLFLLSQFWLQQCTKIQ